MGGEVVNLREAAKLTGWSVKTLRRRCTAGELAGAQRVKIGAGQAEWVIPRQSLPYRQGIGSGQVATGGVDKGAPTAHGDSLAALAAVITDLTARLAEAQGEVVRLTGEAAEARGQLLQLQAGQGGVFGRLRRSLRG